MPEGVEVKLIVTQLNARLAGQFLQSVDVLSGRYARHKTPDGFDSLSTSLPIQLKSVSCKGKFIYFTFADDQHMFCTLGMTANWGSVPEKHSRVKFHFDQGPVYFNDVRNFGTLRFVQGDAQLEAKLSELGWDPLESPGDAGVINRALQKGKHVTCAELLMDQKVFAGVGNYIKAESLYRAEISPWRLCRTLSEDDTHRLRTTVHQVMQDSFAAGGTTIQDYRDMTGKVGTFQSQMRVYGRMHDPDGNPVVAETTLDGRTSHWVPQKQH